jgi:hypothetical protein
LSDKTTKHQQLQQQAQTGNKSWKKGVLGIGYNES